MRFNLIRTSALIGNEKNPKHPPCPQAQWDAKQEVWYVRLTSLKQLLEFSQAVGELVLMPKKYCDVPGPVLEIYDSWRE